MIGKHPMKKLTGRMKRLTGRQWTLLGLGSSAAILSGVEGNAFANREGGDTISAVVHDAAAAYPVILGLGVATLVHFATPIRTPGEPRPWWQGPGVAMAGGALLGLGWVLYDRSRV